jgi:hypothetical protein
MYGKESFIEENKWYNYIDIADNPDIVRSDTTYYRSHIIPWITR